MLDRRVRVLSVLAGEARKTGQAAAAKANLVSGGTRDLVAGSKALARFKKAVTADDMRAALIAYFASPTILWS